MFITQNLGERWAAICKWTEDRWVLIQKILRSWQDFTEEQVLMRNKKALVSTKVQYFHQIVHRIFGLFIVISLLRLLVMLIRATVAEGVNKATRTNQCLCIEITL